MFGNRYLKYPLLSPDSSAGATGSASPEDNGTVATNQQMGQDGQTQAQDLAKGSSNEQTQVNSTTTKGATSPSFTKEDVDKIKSAQFAAGRATVMKELGFTPEQGKDMATQTAAFKQWQESQKTEAEKAQGEVQRLVGENKDLLLKVTAFEKKMAAITAGVPTDKLDWYIRLADARDGEDTFDDKLSKAIEEFPLPKRDVPVISKGQSKQGSNPNGEKSFNFNFAPVKPTQKEKGD